MGYIPLESRELHREPEFLLLATSAGWFDTDRTEPNLLDPLSLHKPRGIEVERAAGDVIDASRMRHLEQSAR